MMIDDLLGIGVDVARKDNVDRNSQEQGEAENSLHHRQHDAEVRWGEGEVRWGEGEVRWGEGEVRRGEGEVRWGEGEVRWGSSGCCIRRQRSQHWAWMGGGESHLVAVRHVDVILLVLVEGTQELL